MFSQAMDFVTSHPLFLQGAENLVSLGVPDVWASSVLVVTAVVIATFVFQVFVGPPLFFFLNVLDRILALVSPSPYDKFKNERPPYSVETGVSAVDGETKPRRNVEYPNVLLQSPFENEDVKTIHDLWVRSVQKFPDNKCLGTRARVREHHDKKGDKTFVYLELGDLKYETYKQVGKQVDNIGSGLRAWGVEPGDNVGIYQDTHATWMMAAQAAFSQSMVVVTCYATLGEDALIHSINQTELEVIFCTADLVGMLIKIAEHCDSLKKVVVTTKVPYASEKEQYENDETLEIISLDDLQKMGATDPQPKKTPQGDDLAVIMYTSGSTGMPKGVMIHHEHLVAAVAGIANHLQFKPEDKEIYLGYLPLAHVLELVAENCMLSFGFAIGYGHPRTLTEKGTRHCKGDLAVVAPTLMAGVPKVYDTVRKGAMAKVNGANPIVKALFKYAFNAKKKAVKAGRATPVWDKLVFGKLRAALGGRLKRLISGGAPLHPETQEWLQVCMGVIVGQGYGLTETCGGCCVQNGGDLTPATIGSPIPSCEVKLVSVPDLNYSVDDKPNPRGELWLRGGNVTAGYYKNEEKTAEAYVDGWFRTGDVAELLPTGSFKIIDRVKNLVKLSTGEYIALESLENKYGNSPLVAPNGICISADSLRDRPVAVIMPHPDNLKTWAAANGVPTNDWEALCANPNANKAVLDSINKEWKANKLHGFEKLQAICLVAEEWTPDSGMLTAAQKLKRQRIYEAYADEITALYE